jgi:hypothetical protein
MAISRYWRIVGVGTVGGGDLELSELRIYSGGSVVDAGATLTASIAPASGSTADLADGSAAAPVIWTRAQYGAPGFALTWDFGSGSGVDNPAFVFGSGASRSTFLFDFVCQRSDDGLSWVQYGAATSVTYPGAAAFTALGDSSSFTPTTMDPANKGSAATLTNGNLTVTANNTAAAKSIASASSGKWYWECTLAYTSLSAIANAAANVGNGLTYPGQDANSWAFYAYDGSTLHSGVNPSLGCGGFPNGSPGTVGMMLDMDAGTLNFKVNGVVYTGFTGLSGTMFAFVGSAGGGSGAWQNGYGGVLNFGATPFVQSVPIGYTPGFGTRVSALATVDDPLQHKARSVVQRPFAVAPAGGTGDAGMQTLMREYTFMDAYNGGKGSITGTVKEKNMPSNVPLRRRVLLVDEASRITIRETWSDAASGAFEFLGIKQGVKYSTVSYDHLHNYRAVIADNQDAT